jgi:hypothetical protein
LDTLTDFRTVLNQTQSYIYPATTDIVQDNTEPGASIFGATDHCTDNYSVLETKKKGDAYLPDDSYRMVSVLARIVQFSGQADPGHW